MTKTYYELVINCARDDTNASMLSEEQQRHLQETNMRYIARELKKEFGSLLDMKIRIVKV